jgi:hypothetical protein
MINVGSIPTTLIMDESCGISWQPKVPVYKFLPCAECNRGWVVSWECRSCQYAMGFAHGSTPLLIRAQSDGREHPDAYEMGFQDGKGLITE